MSANDSINTDFGEGDTYQSESNSISSSPLHMALAKPTRSRSSIHAAISRDYDRKKLADKHELKAEKDQDVLERKMISHAKWNQRAENNNLRAHPVQQDRSVPSLEDYLQRQRIKQENIIRAKQMGNDSIRRASISVVPKV